MAYSEKFEKVKQWFSLGLWNEKRVRNAVEKGWITEAEFAEITAKEYADK